MSDLFSKSTMLKGITVGLTLLTFNNAFAENYSNQELDHVPTLCAYHLEEHKRCLARNRKDECQKQLVWVYTLALYYPLNEALRGPKPDKDCVKIAQDLKRAIAVLPLYRGRVYRGMDLIPELKNLKENECFSDSAFVSTSKKLSVAQSFAGPRALLTIEVDHGRDISDISAFRNEQEVLLAPNTFLKLAKAPEKTSTYTSFILEEVAREDCGKDQGL